MPPPRSNGALADGPPLGEKGSATPHVPWVGRDSVWGDSLDSWVGTLGSPTVTQLGEMLDRDGKAETLYNVLTLPLRWAQPELQEAKDGDAEAQFVHDALWTPPHEGGMSTPLDHVIAQVAGAVVYRKTFMEKVWRLVDGRVSYTKLAYRPADSCSIRRTKDGSFNGFEQRVPFDHSGSDKGVVTFDPVKAFVYFHDQARAPLVGRSALETAYRAYDAKQKVRYLWFLFVERMATPWAEARDENNPDGAEALARKVASLKGGGVVSTTQGQSMNLHEVSSNGEAFQNAMDWLSAEMSGSVLASFTDLAQQGSGRGSFALSADQSDFFLRARYADLAEMSAALTTYVVAPLVFFNFGPQGRTPRLKFAKLTQENADAVKDLWQALATASVPNPVVPRDFFQLLTEQLASALEMDADRVKAMFETEDGEITSATAQRGANQVLALLGEAGVGPTPATEAA